MSNDRNIQPRSPSPILRLPQSPVDSFGILNLIIGICLKFDFWCLGFGILVKRRLLTPNDMIDL